MVPLVAGFALPACDRGGERACGPEEHGTVWATAGAGSPALRRIDLCPLRTVPVVPDAAVFSVGAAGDLVVVATDPTAPPPEAGSGGEGEAPPATVAFGGNQRLARLVDGRLEPLPDLHALAWSPDGRRLLAQDQRNHLGYLSPPGLADFQRLGDVGSSGLVDAAWAR